MGWHQDRTISVDRRAEIASYGPGTVEQVLLHVQPPFALLERLVTLHIHLDPVTHFNAPLEIARGSHSAGLIAEHRVPEVVAASDVHLCPAEPGDVWAYTTPILRASRRSVSAGSRRVLQIDESADTLPTPLEWELAQGNPMLDAGTVPRLARCGIRAAPQHKLQCATLI